MFTRLRTRTTALVEASRPPDPPTIVASQHIPYVEPLWTRLQAAKRQVEQKREYLRATDRLAIKVAARDNVAAAAEAEGKAIVDAARALERIKRVLALGAEPTTPPEQWFCGLVAEPEGIVEDRWGHKDYPIERWPNRARGRTVMVFEGAMPVAALERYAAAKDLVDDVRVYSPREDDFRRLPEPELRDPVLIGMIAFLGEGQFFELARWDIDEDLAAVFGRVGRGAVS